MEWMVLLLALTTAGIFGAAAVYRARSLRPIIEAVRSSTLRDLTPGRFRVQGRIVPLGRTTASRIDGLPCVFLEHASYAPMGSSLIPVMREVDHFMVAHPFLLDDGTAQIEIDPSVAIVDALPSSEDAGLSAELRLRAGEEIEVIATFARDEREQSGGPYRAHHMAWTAVTDDVSPPMISYRVDPQMHALQATDELTVFLGGVALIALMAGGFFGIVIAF